MRLFTRRLSDVRGACPTSCSSFSRGCTPGRRSVERGAAGFREGKPLRFQDLVRRVRRKESVERMAREMPLEIKAFDILYLKGRVLVGEPYPSGGGSSRSTLTPVSSMSARGDVQEAEARAAG